MASSAVPESSAPDAHSVSVERFQTLDGANFATDHPLTKTALLYLSEIWPRSVTFHQLVTEAQARLGPASSRLEAGQEVQMLGANLLKAYSYSENLVELHIYAPRFVGEVSDCPEASPVVRLQAQRGDKITNLRHERITLDNMAAALLTYLDGSRDQAALLAIMQEKDMVEIERRDGRPVVAQDIQIALSELLQQKLQQFARAALLIG
jgi:hypothetical protein